MRNQWLRVLLLRRRTPSQPYISQVHHLRSFSSSLLHPRAPRVSPNPLPLHRRFTSSPEAAVEPPKPPSDQAAVVADIFAEFEKSSAEIKLILDDKGVVMTNDLILSVLGNPDFDPDDAMRFFYWVLENKSENLSSQSYNLMLGILGGNGFVKETWDILEIMKERGYSVSNDTFRKISERFQKDGLNDNVKKLNELYDTCSESESCISNDASENNVVEEDYCWVSDLIKREVWGDDTEKQLRELDVDFSSDLVTRVLGNLEMDPNRALIFFRWIQGSGIFKHDQQSFNAMARVLGKEDNSEKFWRFANEMKNEGHEMERETYIHILGQFIKKEMIKDAVDLYEFSLNGEIKSSEEDCVFLLNEIVVSEELDMDLFSKVLGFFKDNGNTTSDVILNSVTTSLITNLASSERHLVKIVCAIVVKGHWDKLLKPMIGSVVTSSVINRALLSLSPHGFLISWSFFKWVETIPQYKPSLQSSWTMICILTKQRHFRIAQNLLEKIARKDFLSSPIVLNALVNSYVDLEVISHVLSWLVIFYANSNMNPDALQVFDHMRVCGYKPHLHACTALLNSLVKERLTDTVWKVYKKMTKMGVIPNLHVYNVLIHACCKSGDVDKAEELLCQMESINIFPDIFTYNTLISLYCKKGMHYEALSVQDRMKSGGLCPDIVTYNSLIYSYCREGRMREALRLFKDIRDASPNHVTYTTLIDGYCRAGDLDEALKLLDTMEVKQLYPGVITYNALLRKLCEEGRLQDANKILNEMSERKVEPDVVTCNTLINAYCKIGDMGSALRFKSNMMEGGLRPDQYTYKALIHGYCKAGEVNRAKEMLFDMLGAGFSPNHCVYAWFVDFYCDKNNDEAIVMLIDELEKGGLCVDISAYRAIIRRLCKKDRTECAENVYKLMGARGVFGDSIVYISLAYAYFRAGEAVAALALLDEMYKRRLVVTLRIFRSISASYSNDGSKLDVFWDTLTERGLISKPIYAQIQQMKL